MSDTPRTDQYVTMRASLAYCVEKDTADFARQLERELAEVTKQRDEWKELYERLNESLASNKRLFSSKLAEKVIDDQVKRIKFLEDILSKTQKELLELKKQ